MNARFRLLITLFVAPCALAQIGVTVGPSPAPMNCPIAITIANDTPAQIWTGLCPFIVRNAAGATVYAPICPAIAIPVSPGAVFTTSWNQIDDSGVVVPAGSYFVDVFTPGGLSTTQISISATTNAAVTTLGPNRIGTTRSLRACSPLDGGFGYLMGASGPPISGGVPTCGGVVPLEIDALLLLSLGPNPFFTNFSGTLDASGVTEQPSITVPFSPSLVGASFFVAFIVTDPAAPCFVRTISAPTIILIV